MPNRTVWSLFTLVFIVIGAIAGWQLAGIYVANLGVEQGRFLWLDVSSGKPLDGSGALLAKIALGLGGILIGFLVSTVAHNEMQRLRKNIDTMSVQDKIALIAGLMIGLVMTVLLAASIPMKPEWILAIAVFLCYLSVTVTLSMKEQLRIYFPGAVPPGKTHAQAALRPKILDTNVIIDGRISDICKAGFIEGSIYIPRFVLEELQQIADSSDSLKRARGRRGLDILNQMQQEMSMQIQTYESANDNGADEVDAKLVELAKALNGVIVTNDFNLNKVAVLQGVKVLNVNELANALKPVVLPGEEMAVTIIKEGKEQNQGVGYLDDGTMIVVERARQRIGETLDVVVTSILQTPAGKMIFAMIGDDGEEDTGIERNIRSYSGSRQRRKIR